MTRQTLEQYLLPAPPAVRRAMLEDRASLLRGAAAVVGRFFEVLKRRREPEDNPSPETFRAAAGSEAALRTLLVSLTRYAPRVSTASGRIVRAERYAARSEGKTRRPRRISPMPAIAPESWPEEWRAMYPSLLATPLAESTKRRYSASLTRLAPLIRDLELSPQPSFYIGYCLAEVLEGQGVRHRTIAGYLDALVGLGAHGGAEPRDLDGLRKMRDLSRQRAQVKGKLKTPRISALMERGGFEEIARIAVDLWEKAASLPAHTAEHEACLQAAVLILIHLNKPGRTGDVAKWRFGRELLRDPDGTWALEWEQEKTDNGTSAGRLWPEVSELLDAWILGGRPDRFVHLRYRELVGSNWMTLSDTAHPSRWPSEIIKRHIGVPSHDLRTLSADYLRHHDPATAADIISTHLGHRSQAAGEEYRALAEGDAASRAWADVRQRIMTGNR